jgi:molecular chaperone GrpE
MTEDPAAVEEKESEVSKAESLPAKETEAEVESLRKERDELLTRMKYLQADFENYRKRIAREAEAFAKFAHEDLLARLLPVLDEFDAALAHLDGPAREGTAMVRDDLVKALRDVGLEEIPAQGQAFDPYLHDCVERVPDSKAKDGLVKEVVRKGYRLRDRVLRPAQVVVVKNQGDTNG